MQEYRNLWASCSEIVAIKIFTQIVSRLASSASRWSVDNRRVEYYKRVNPLAVNHVLFVGGKNFDDCCISTGIDVSVCLSYNECCVYANGANGIQVVNIVPTAGRNSLLKGEYNLILEAFRNEVVGDMGVGDGVVWQMSSGMCSYRDFVPASCVEDFLRFVQLANKSCAATHPSDRLAWNQFIMGFVDSTVPAPRILTPDILRQLLVEDYMWDGDAAYELARDFEVGVNLLKLYHVR